MTFVKNISNMKHFINLKDIPHKDLRKIIVDAKKRKKKRKKLNTLEPDKGSPLKGKMLVQMFEKASSRTRISFYLAIKQLGGGTLTLRSNELHLGQGGETIADTAKILSTYGDGFMLRTDDDKKIDDFQKHLTIPIINGLSPSSHPTQVLSDIFTVEEIKKKPISKLKICWIGDANNVLESLIAASVNTLVVSWNEAAEINDSVCKDALVIPIKILSPTAGALFSAFNLEFNSSKFVFSIISPGKRFESPGILISIFLSICLKITSMCLSFIITPCSL